MIFISASIYIPLDLILSFVRRTRLARARNKFMHVLYTLSATPQLPSNEMERNLCQHACCVTTDHWVLQDLSFIAHDREVNELRGSKDINTLLQDSTINQSYTLNSFSFQQNISTPISLLSCTVPANRKRLAR